METGAGADMRMALQKAIRDGDIQPAFQPIVTLQGRQLVGFEVLSRWDSPEFGNVSPGVFIPLAEEEGFIDQLSRKLIREACMTAARWQGSFCLALNISPIQFQDPDLYHLITEALSETGFCSTRLIIEMTENAAFSDKEEVSSVIEKLRSVGVSFALDDFGTGYSNFLRLQTFPIRWIKIDASFVRLITENENTRAIIASIIALGHDLNVDIVAEGIETEAQADLLEELGCPMGQGWLLGEPLSAQEAEAYAKLHK